MFCGVSVSILSVVESVRCSQARHTLSRLNTKLFFYSCVMNFNVVERGQISKYIYKNICISVHWFSRVCAYDRCVRARARARTHALDRTPYRITESQNTIHE